MSLHNHYSSVGPVPFAWREKPRGCKSWIHNNAVLLHMKLYNTDILIPDMRAVVLVSFWLWRRWIYNLTHIQPMANTPTHACASLKMTPQNKTSCLLVLWYIYLLFVCLFYLYIYPPQWQINKTPSAINHLQFMPIMFEIHCVAV